MWRSPILLLVSVCLISACGTPGKQLGSDNCDSSFVSDYNEVIRDYQIMLTLDDARRTKTKATELKAKYPGLVCTAEVKKKNGLGDENISINVNSKMDEIISLINTISGI